MIACDGRLSVHLTEHTCIGIAGLATTRGNDWKISSTEVDTGGMDGGKLT